MKTITLFRPKEHFNKNVSYQIYIGKALLTELKNGEEKEIEIPDALENSPLIAKIKWCGSEEIALHTIANNDMITVSGNGFLNQKLSLFGAIFPLMGFLFFDLQWIPKKMGITVLLVCLVALVSTFTLFKNKWIGIKQHHLPS